MNKKQSIGLCSLLLTSVFAHADISGTVFKDIPFNGTVKNTYGTKDTNEQGVAGITVTAYPSGASTITEADGTWFLTTTGKVKVEFTNIPSYLKEGAGQSSVQFIDGDASTINLALYNPADYAGETNPIAMTTQANSALVDNSAVALKILSTIPAVDNVNIPEDISKDVSFQKLGTVWGLAYDKAHKDLYAAASLRRYGALGNDGLGAIYKIHDDGAVETFTTIVNVGTITSNAQRNLSTNPNNPSHDPVFNEIGRVGLGDIDISEDGTKLYAINITTNSLVEVDIATKVQKAIAIGNPFTGCSDGDVKSWGIGQKDGEVYVGSVCTTNTTQGAYISKLEGSTFTSFHHIPLDMKGENSLYTYTTNGLTNPNGERWRSWITNLTDLFNPNKTHASLPAPILSDIIFDENRGMILGFIDRTAMQTGVDNFSPDTQDAHTYRYDSAGDIYRVCNVNGTYKNEGDAGCPLTDTTGHEFFKDDEWTKQNGGHGKHKEITLGGLSYLQGSGTVATSAFDPAEKDGEHYDTSGIIWMNRDNGTKLAGQVMVGGPDSLVYNGKAGGVGDLEVLAEAAPTEIGDRVWFDENANCVQDANESGIAGVEVNLYAFDKCEGTPEQTVTTDGNGRYLFPVTAGTQYSVCINGVAGQTPLDGKKLTCNDKGTSINNSDATVAGADAKIALAPLTTGANDHSLDFGFTTKEAPVTEPVVTTPVVTPTPTPTDSNRTVDHTNGTCDCHSYTEDSTPALSIWSMMLLMTLTSFMAFLFRKELNQVIK